MITNTIKYFQRLVVVRFCYLLHFVSFCYIQAVPDNSYSVGGAISGKLLSIFMAKLI